MIIKYLLILPDINVINNTIKELYQYNCMATSNDLDLITWINSSAPLSTE